MLTEQIQYLEKKLQDNPESILFARLADSYLKAERIDDALRVCEEGVRKHPHYVTGHLILGKCYLAKRLYDQAEREFKRVLLFDPKHLSAHKHIGDLMKKIGWENTYEMSYRRIAKIDPLNEDVRAVLREIEREKKKPEEHIPSEQRMKEISRPEKPQVKEEVEQKPTEEEKKFSYILDDIFKDEVIDETKTPIPGPERSEEIPIERPKEEIPQRPSSGREPIVTPTLGEIYAAQGHFDKAIRVYEMLMSKNPDNETYRQRIEELRRKLEEARGE